MILKLSPGFKFNFSAIPEPINAVFSFIEEKSKAPSENFKSEVIFLSAKNFSNSTARI